MTLNNPDRLAYWRQLPVNGIVRKCSAVRVDMHLLLPILLSEDIAIVKNPLSSGPIARISVPSGRHIAYLARSASASTGSSAR